MTLAEAVLQALSRGLPRLDAQMLVLHAAGRTTRDRAWLLTHGSDTLSSEAQMNLQALLQRRAQGEPMAYLTGHKEFYGLNLAVDARVLDPRADTETLVDWALERMDKSGASAPYAPRAIDLGTGSGAIALALQTHRPDWQVHAVDRSTDALDVARANAQRLGIPVQFHQGNWLDGQQGMFSLIVANPPYIAENDQHLAKLTHEPLQALVSGADGLADIQRIIAQTQARLLPGAWLLLEHGYDQSAKVRALLREAGFLHVQSRKDLAGIERCSGGQWPAAPSDA